MEKELLFSITRKDFVIEHTRGSGPGGQHRNKSATGRRITHPESGVSVNATDGRSAEQNLRNAFRRLIEDPKFKSWFRMRVAQEYVSDAEIRRRVEEAMDERNLKVEIKENGRWVPAPDDLSDSDQRS